MVSLKKWGAYPSRLRRRSERVLQELEIKMNWIDTYFQWKVYLEVIGTVISLVIILSGLIYAGILGIKALIEKHKWRKNR